MIAIVEDDRMTNEYIKNLIVNEGWTVDTFFTGEEFLKAAENTEYSCVILDIGLKLMSGFDTLYFLKKNQNKYGKPKCLILSAKDEQENVNKGLRLGADDYIKKPFDDEELILRLNSLVLRENRVPLERINYKGTIFDFTQGEIIFNSEKIRLSKSEVKILEYFFSNKGLVVRRERFYDIMWNEEYQKGDKKMEACISRLKKKIPVLNDILIVYRGLGYKLET